MTNKELLKEIKKLKKENLALKGLSIKEKAKAFSSVDTKYLNKVVTIKENLDKERFNKWFNNNIKIAENSKLFLKELLDKYGDFINKYNEDTLKMKFISLILEEISFLNKTLEISDFYHAPLSYKNEKVNFNGFCDFYVAKGLKTPDNPYFFIQEYKPSQGGGDPEPQLVAELISAVEINQWKEIKGCFIVGAIWNFVILEKLEKNKYQYFVSRNFDSTRIEDLKDIFRNLLFVKNEIFEFVKVEIYKKGNF